MKSNRKSGMGDGSTGGLEGRAETDEGVSGGGDYREEGAGADDTIRR